MNLQQLGFFFLLFFSLTPSLPPSWLDFALLRFSRRSLVGGSSAIVAPPQSLCYCHPLVSLEMSSLINTP